jgi:hypothetical protein
MIEKIKINDPQDEITSVFNALVLRLCCEHPVLGVIMGRTEFVLISNNNLWNFCHQLEPRTGSIHF